MLDGCRVLDLCDERGLLTGRMLADLGADVVLVEPPVGTSARSAAPATPSGESSWFFAAYAANRRGIVCDRTSSAGEEKFQQLVAEADIVLVSPTVKDGFSPEAEYERLREINPRLIYVCITAFGTRGPKASYESSDLTLWAAGGVLEPHRSGARPPLRPSIPQAYLHASADAVAGALLAYLARERNGTGQFVDVSVQVSLGIATLSRVLADVVGDVNPEWVPTSSKKRVDQSGSGSGTNSFLKKWECQDGLVELHLAVGPASGGFTNNFFQWMHAEGACDERTAGIDWRSLPEKMASGEFTDEDMEFVRELTGQFLATKTKAQVLDAALQYRLLCIGIYGVADISSSRQLTDRDYWSTVGEGTRLQTLPGPVARVSNDAGAVRRPAPILGEHTDEVLADWLGRSSASQDAQAEGVSA